MKKRTILKKLEKNGFSGVDASIEESLYHHGQLARLKNGVIEVIYRLNDNDDDNNFDYTIIEFSELKDDISNLPKEFFDYIGIAKKEYKISNDINEINNVIYDINMYNGLYMQSCSFTYSFKDIANILKIK